MVERKYSPARMSACGWSSFQTPDCGPESTNVRFGSTYETAGSFPVLQSLKNCDGRPRDRVVLLVPEEEEADVAAVVAAGDALRREPVPDRRQVDARERVLDPVGDAAVEVDPVRERRAEDRGEVAVADRPRGCGGAEERQVGLAVVADREEVAVGREQPAVTGAVVPLDPGSVVRVVRVEVRTALEVGRERERLVRHALERRGTSAPPAFRRPRAASRGDGRTSGSPSSRRRRGRSRTAPGSEARPERPRRRGRARRRRRRPRAIPRPPPRWRRSGAA